MSIRKKCFYISVFVLQAVVCPAAYAIDVLDITATPSLVRSGQAVQVTFRTSEPVLGTPVVTLGGLLMTFDGLGSGVYYYHYMTDGSEPEGYQDVQIDVTDMAGNPGSGSLSDAVYFDFTAPQAQSVTATPALVRSGQTVQVTFQTSESVQGTPTVTLGGHAMSFSNYSGGVYSYEYQADGTETEGGQDVQIDVTDMAGNPGGGSQSDAVYFDFTAPQAQDITTTPAFVGSGQMVQVTFRTSEPVLGTPVVTLGGLLMTFDGLGSGVYYYHYMTDGSEPEGYQDVQIDMTDMAGNPGSGSQSNATQFLWNGTQTPTCTATPSESPTQTHTWTGTYTETGTATPSHTPTYTTTFTATWTSTATGTATWTASATVTFTATPTRTASTTPTVTLTMTPTSSPSVTLTPTVTRTDTSTATTTPTIQPSAEIYYVSKNMFRGEGEPVSIYVSASKYPGHYRLAVYNAAGEFIKVLDDREIAAPYENSCLWDGTNQRSEKCASGMYILYLTAPSGPRLARVLLIR